MEPDPEDLVHIIRSRRGSYSSAIPHIADDELSLYEYRLYGHYCRISDGGHACVERQRVTAQRCNMSASTVHEARESLAAKGYVELHKLGVGRKSRCYVTLLDIEERNVLHCKAIIETRKNDRPTIIQYTLNDRPTIIDAVVTRKNDRPTIIQYTLNDRGAIIPEQITHINDRPTIIKNCTTLTAVEEVRSNIDLTMGTSSSTTVTVVQTNDSQLQSLAVAMLEECGIFPVDAHELAGRHAFEHLRQWTFDWMNNPQKKGPGLLRHIIANNFRRGELSWDDRHSEFYQRYRTPDEMAGEVVLREAAEPYLVSSPAVDVSQTPVIEDPHAAHWATILAELSDQMPSAAYNAYVAGSEVIAWRMEADSELWVIGLRDASALDWVRNRLGNKIKRALASLVGGGVLVEFGVQP